jgi:Flp pilus assembly protein TadD
MFEEFTQSALRRRTDVTIEFGSLDTLHTELVKAQGAAYSKADLQKILEQQDHAFTFTCPNCGQLESSAVLLGVTMRFMQGMDPGMGTIFGGPNIASLTSGRCPGCGGTRLNVTYDPQQIQGIRPLEPEDEAVGIPRKRAIRWWPLLVVIPLLVLVIYAVNQASPPVDYGGGTPVDPMAHLEAGRAHLQAGDMDKAVAEFEAAIQADPTLTEAHFRLGNAYAEQGQLDKAAEEFKAVVGLDASDADAHSNLGVVYYQKGQLDEAVSEFQAALDINPDDAEAHYLLGAAYVQMGRMDEAVKEFNTALEYNAELPEAYFGLGTVYKLQGNVEEAIKAFERFLELGPSQDPQAQVEAEQLLRELKGQ